VPPWALRKRPELLVAGNGAGKFWTKKFSATRKKIDIGDVYADYGLIASTLGWRPRTDLRTALRRKLVFFRKELAHYV